MFDENNCDLKPTLRDFLKKNNAYDAFLRNWKNGNPQTPLEEINSKKGMACFTSAFVSNNTPEKNDYWFDLAIKFEVVEFKKDILERLKKLELALNYVCYDITLIPKYTALWDKIEILENYIEKLDEK